MRATPPSLRNRAATSPVIKPPLTREQRRLNIAGMIVMGNELYDPVPGVDVIDHSIVKLATAGRQGQEVQ